jgi:TonB-dependent SusC/RagA subfamily outer membrane receptor
MPAIRAAALCARTLTTLASALAIAACYHVPSGPARLRHSADDLMNERPARVEELFLGRFPGVRVLRTVGGGLQVSIRGSGLWSADEQPLYVVDGMAVNVTPGRGLDWLAPEDIARIQVLKNAAETTMFGARGANGVVLITTKGPR